MAAQKFRCAALITIVATLSLIFLGALVRAAGAGLGCPDWPTCFGNIVPPLSVQDISITFFQKHPDVRPEQFNAAQTWIEYINRLVGVSVGLLILWTLIRAWLIRSTHKPSFWLSAAAFVLVAYQGWLGGQVVKSKLTEWVITAHMLLALLIFGCLAAAWEFAGPPPTAEMPKADRRKSLFAGIVLFCASLAQVLIGTRVRETVDLNNRLLPAAPRDSWVSRLGEVDLIHRNFAIAVVLAAFLFLIVLLRQKLTRAQYAIGFSIVGLIALQIVFGTVLVSFAFPRLVQVLHLTNGAAIVCLEFLFLISIARTRAQAA